MLEIKLKLTEDVDWHQSDHRYSENPLLRNKFFSNQAGQFFVKGIDF